MKKLSIACFLTILASSVTLGQSPSFKWSKTIGGTNEDFCHALIENHDGSYLLAGYASSSGELMKDHHGESDLFLVNLKEDGEFDWIANYGGSKTELLKGVYQTDDGGYILAASSMSADGDVPGNKGEFDAWILKINKTGKLKWSKCYGGSDHDMANAIVQTKNGEYIMVGHTLSEDGDITGNKGQQDMWVLKLDEDGEKIWSKTFGGSNSEVAKDILALPDGEILVVGFTKSNDGDVAGNYGEHDVFILKLDKDGNVLWKENYGGSEYDEANAVIQTLEGDFVIAGSSRSKDRDVSENKGNWDFWVLKISSTGERIWQESFGGSQYEYAHDIAQTVDGDYLITGVGTSNDHDLALNWGKKDFWTIKFNDAGELLWQKSMGGSGDDIAYAISTTRNGGCIIAGQSDSKDGEVGKTEGKNEIWVVKLRPYKN